MSSVHDELEQCSRLIIYIIYRNGLITFDSRWASFWLSVSALLNFTSLEKFSFNTILTLGVIVTRIKQLVRRSLLAFHYILMSILLHA